MFTPKRIKIFALIFLGLMVAFLIYGGGIRYYLIALAGIFLGWLGWKRPLPGGIVLCVLAILLASYFLFLYVVPQVILPPLIFICAPMAISGLLLIESEWKVRKPTS